MDLDDRKVCEHELDLARVDVFLLEPRLHFSPEHATGGTLVITELDDRDFCVRVAQHVRIVHAGGLPLTRCGQTHRHYEYTGEEDFHHTTSLRIALTDC